MVAGNAGDRQARYSNSVRSRFILAIIDRSRVSQPCCRIATDQTCNGISWCETGRCSRRAIIHLGHARIGKRRRQGGGSDGDRGIGVIQRGQCVVGCQTTAATCVIGQRDGIDELVCCGHMRIIGCGSAIAQRFSTDASCDGDRTRQTGGAIVGLTCRQADGLGGDCASDRFARGIQNIVAGGRTVVAGNTGDRQARYSNCVRSRYILAVIDRTRVSQRCCRIATDQTCQCISRCETGRCSRRAVIHLGHTHIG